MFAGDKFEGFQRWYTRFDLDNIKVGIFVVGDEVRFSVQRTENSELVKIYGNYINRA
jgi:hypothetical protein